MTAADRPSQALLNAQKELEKRRRLAGISYRPPQPASSDRAESDWFMLPASRFYANGRKPANHPLPPRRQRCASPRPSPPIASTRTTITRAMRLTRPTASTRSCKRSITKAVAGWPITYVTAALTRKDSPQYIYGRRQLKNILQRGEVLFWQRVKSKGELRIRLMARAKVASRLLDGRLRGQEVSFPLQHLLGSGRGRQAAVNAALYTAVHAGQITRKGKAGPISRARLRDVSGCSSYRQRRYERRMGITIATHIHILGQHSAYELQRARYHQGLPAYKHTDYLGKINRHRRGADYIARRLPNSYCTPDTFAVIHSRRQRTINRQLAGLCLMGSEGSGSDKYVRLFHENASIGRTRLQPRPADHRVLPACQHNKNTVMAIAFLILSGDLD